jgi:hypothetical protein
MSLHSTTRADSLSSALTVASTMALGLGCTCSSQACRSQVEASGMGSSGSGSGRFCTSVRMGRWYRRRPERDTWDSADSRDAGNAVRIACAAPRFGIAFGAG